jgi:O-antigen/teichoic acid export membrane protein
MARNVQNVAHGTAVLRGVAGTLFMLASVLPLIAVYDLADHLAAFLAVSLVPLLRGFTHLDYRLHNRLLRFNSTIAIEIVSSVAGLAAAASVFIVPGVEAFAGVLLVQAACAVLLSHVLASRRYRVGFDSGIRSRLWQAGWPLALNALLIYAVFQGEKLIVGGVLGLEVLGSYAIAAQLALLPVMIAGRLSIGLVLPVLSRAGTDTPRGVQARRDVMHLFFAGGMLFWIGFVMLAPPVIHLLFGAEYAQSAAVMSWIAAAAALRLQKTGATTLLLASGRSKDILAGNSARIVALAIGTLAMVITRDLTVFLAMAAIGEGVSYAMAAHRASPSRVTLFLCLPVLAVAVAQSVWPFSKDIALPLAGVLVAGSMVALVRLGHRYVLASGRQLQQAAG